MLQQCLTSTQPFFSLATKQFDNALALTIALTIRSVVFDAKEAILPQTGSGWSSRVIFEFGFILILLLILFTMRQQTIECGKDS
jgi:hypothetical protein